MICHHYKCIFVHIPKNAGQSIEHVFLNLLNLSWQTRTPLLLMPNDRPEIGPPRLAHLKAQEYVRYKYLTQEIFDNYFKFAFVRNPWSRLVSIYKHMGYDKKREFKQFLMRDFKETVFRNEYWFVGPQSDFVCDDNGNILVDFIGRFESLQNDFDYVCKKIGLLPTQVPHVNKAKNDNLVFSLRPKKLTKYVIYNIAKKDIPGFTRYQDYYDNESRQFVAEWYKRDIELFGYDFD